MDGTVNLVDVNDLAKYLAGWEGITVNGSFFAEYLNTYHSLTEVQSKLKLNNRATFNNDALRMEWSASGFTVQGQFEGDFVLNDVVATKEIYHCRSDVHGRLFQSLLLLQMFSGRIRKNATPVP